MTGIRPPWRLLLGASLALAAGCYVPVSNAAPHGASTVGVGQVRVSGTVEYPVVDQLETTASPPDASAPDRFPTARAPYGSLQVSYGIADDLDVDVGVDGELQAVIPVPHGGYLGFRYAPYRSPLVHLGMGVRFGYAGFLATLQTPPYDGATAQVYHGSVSVGATVMRWRRVQPTLSISVQPLQVQATFQGDPLEPMRALNTAATLGLRVYWFTPFVSAGWLRTDNVRGNAPYFTFGVARSL